MLTIGDLNIMLHECKEELISLGLREIEDKYYNIKINSRFRNKLGRCSYDRKSYFYTIEINQNFIRYCPDKIKNTIMHELIHSVNGCMNHGPNFQYLASLVNQNFGYNVSTTSYYSAYDQYLNNTKNYKYKVKCSHCGKEWLYEKAGKIVRNIQHDLHSCRCPICKNKTFSVVNL